MWWINVREYRKVHKTQYEDKQTKTLEKTEEDNQEWTIKRQWQHWVHKTQDEDRKKRQKRYTAVNKVWSYV